MLEASYILLSCLVIHNETTKKDQTHTLISSVVLLVNLTYGFTHGTYHHTKHAYSLHIFSFLQSYRPDHLFLTPGDGDAVAAGALPPSPFLPAPATVRSPQARTAAVARASAMSLTILSLTWPLRRGSGFPDGVLTRRGLPTGAAASQPPVAIA